MALYRQLGFRPAALDVHIYEKDAAKVTDLLRAAQRVAAQIGVPLDINETFYDHPNLFTTIRQLRAAQQLPALREVLVWPLRVGFKGAINVSAPYDIAALRAQLGLPAAR